MANAYARWRTRYKCLIPDEHIALRRSALFLARSVLRGIRDGFDPAKVRGALYFNDPQTKHYIPLGKKLYEKILNGDIRF